VKESPKYKDGGEDEDVDSTDDEVTNWFGLCWSDQICFEYRTLHATLLNLLLDLMPPISK